MGTHRRIGEAFEHGVDITASLDELEKTIVETLAEVELARRGGSYPWDTQRRGKHAGRAQDLDAAEGRDRARERCSGSRARPEAGGSTRPTPPTAMMRQWRHELTHRRGRSRCRGA